MGDSIGSRTGATRHREHPSSGWAYAGSRRQIQAYVNTPSLTYLLNAAVTDAWHDLSAGQIDWRAPLATDRYQELMDSTFWTAIQRLDLKESASTWWPRRGPSWDAVGGVTLPGRDQIVLLVEAKAHIAEFAVGEFGGTKPRSIEMITAALDHTRVRLGATAPVDAWLGSHYQLANRLTWTSWLRGRGIDARYAYVLFANDRSYKPTSVEDLATAAHAGYAALGLSPPDHLWIANITLDAIG
jgi:hypothetical protein